MVRTIPLTHYAEYLAQAKAIQQAIGEHPTPAAVQQAVVALADLAARALDETLQAVEGLAALMIALHPDVTRRAAPPHRRTNPATSRRPGPGKK